MLILAKSLPKTVSRSGSLSDMAAWKARCSIDSLRYVSYKDHIEGISIEEICKSHAEAKQSEHLGFDEENRRAAIWAGTGVGLVRKKAPAAEIIAEVRESARTALERTVSLLATF